jgi:peptidoglycan-associated lipoprotein
MKSAFLLATVIIAGCGHEPPRAPGVANVPSPPSVPSPVPGGTEPSARPIQVSNEILRVCQIAQPEVNPNFDFNSTDISVEDRHLLEAVATCFTTGALKGRSMRLIGRADRRGENEYNMGLGANRAGSVYNYLASFGVDVKRIESTSRGELDATGSDEGGWRRDRRVDIDLVK